MSSDDDEIAEDAAVRRSNISPEDAAGEGEPGPVVEVETHLPGAEARNVADLDDLAPQAAAAAPPTGPVRAQNESRLGKTWVIGTGVLAAVAFISTTLALGARSTLAPEQADIILAIDVSLSMQASDVHPSRFDVTKAAAVRFADLVPRKVKVGLVSFAGTAQLLVSPTTDRAELKSRIRDLQLSQRTAVGEAVLSSLAGVSSAGRRIVLVSDGGTTIGRSDEEAARAASAAAVPVFTIAIGTPKGTVVVQDREIPVPVDKDPLRRMAQTTHGRFYEATSAEEMDRAYANLVRYAAYRQARAGVTAFSVAISSAVAAALGGLVLLLGRRRRGRKAVASPDARRRG